MNRLPWLFRFGVILLGVSAACGIGRHSGVVCGDRAATPNLLIIHTDEHNFRTLGSYRDTLPPEQAFVWGDAVVETPNIDWIAHNGALSTSFYATTPTCSPSRAAFMSGRYPHTTSVHSNSLRLDDEVITFAEILRREGYATGYAGKWHLDGTLGVEWRIKRNPHWAPKRKFGFEDNRYMFDRGHWKQLEDTAAGPRVKSRPGNIPNYSVVGADEKSFTTDFLADKTVEYIHSHKERPFLFMLSLPDPHGPDRVRPPYDTMFRGQRYEKPRSALKANEGLPSWGQKRQEKYDQSQYYGMVKCIDDNVGKILQALRDAGVIDRTIVVFTADHGDLRGEHGRQNKDVPYEGSARIPFVIYYPDRIKPGTVVDEALSCVDFLPTILSLMGVESAGTEHGRDASQLLTTGRVPSDWNDIVFLRGPGRERGWLAAVTDRYKIIYSTADDPWLFDLEKDPDELVNVVNAPAYREEVRELSRQLADYGKKYNDPRAAHVEIQADLEWAVSGTGPYVSRRAVRPAAGPRR